MKVLTLSSRVEQFCSCVLVIAFVQLTFSSIVRAQDLDTVTIAGRITDQNGAVIPGAIVLAELIKTGVPRTMNADDRGRYRMMQLEPGVYSLRVSATGFDAQEKTDLTLVAR